MEASAPPPGALELYEAQLIQQLNAYFDHTKLLAVIQAFARELTQRFSATRLVPTDVYSPLLTHFRLAEINSTELLVTPRPRELKTLAATISSQELLLFVPHDGRSSGPMERQIATFKAQSPPPLAMWGLRHVLERIPYSRVWQRSVENKCELVMMWLSESESTDEACAVRCAGALVGYEGFFTMTTLAPLTVEIERHVVVEGEQLEQAMTAFARQLIRSLVEATKKNAVVRLPHTEAQLTLVSVGAIQILIAKGSMDDHVEWTLERVTANRQAFVAAVKMALVVSGGFLMDLLYEQSSTVKSFADSADDHVGDDRIRFVRCRVWFFFHFDSGAAPAQPGAAMATTGRVKVASRTSQSFVSQCRLHESGLFVSTRSAYDLTRRYYDQQERDAAAAKPEPTNSDVPPLEGLVNRVLGSTRSSVETRHWLSILSGSFAFRLAQLLSLIDVMLHVVSCVFVVEDDSSTATLIFKRLGPSILLYQRMIHELIEDASIGRSSSLLKGLEAVIRDLCRLPQDEPHCDSIDVFCQQLLCSREVIFWVYSTASRDFQRLATLTTTGELALAMTPSADLRVDIAAAIEERCYPPAIVAETVFAQYLVNTRLDVALEQSMVNTVAHGLPPNPFVPFSSHLRVFAVQSILKYNEQRRQPTTPVKIETIQGVGFALQSTGLLKHLVSANSRLLQHLNVTAIASIHGFLTKQHVYCATPYNPPKASYSARIFASLMADDPLLTTSEPLDGTLIQRIEVVEHIVLEGTDHAQALSFFADAVRRDVQRLLSSQPCISAQLTLLNPDGDALTMVELRDIQTFEQLVIEATPKQCMLQITLPPVLHDRHIRDELSEPLLRLVAKSYQFHHVSSSPATSHSNCLGPRVVFRLSTFAVFMDIDSAALVLADLKSSGRSHCDISHRTSYSLRATMQNDSLQLDYLAWISSPSTVETSDRDSPPALLLYLLGMESGLSWLLDRLQETSTESRACQIRADEVASLSAALLPRVAQNIKRLLLPVVDSVGFVDAAVVKDKLASMSTITAQQNSTDAWLLATEECVRRVWVLLRFVRGALYADTIDRQL